MNWSVSPVVQMGKVNCPILQLIDDVSKPRQSVLKADHTFSNFSAYFMKLNIYVNMLKTLFVRVAFSISFAERHLYLICIVKMNRGFNPSSDPLNTWNLKLRLKFTLNFYHLCIKRFLFFLKLLNCSAFCDLNRFWTLHCWPSSLEPQTGLMHHFLDLSL